MKRLAMVLALAMPGCASFQPVTDSIRPLVEMAHVSHLTQHVKSRDANDAACVPKCGYNAYSLGIRIRPASIRGLSIDLLEGITTEHLDGQKEVFTGRFTWEIGARQ